MAGATERTAPRRRGRPRTHDTGSGLEPSEEILRHAAMLFSAKGVGATTVTDIAASIGISAPAIYYHYDNLDAIVEALLTYVVDESAAFATAAATTPGGCSDRLEALIRQHVDRLTSGPYDLWFVAGLSEAEAERFPAITKKASQWRRAVARLLAEGVGLGEFRPLDTQLAVAAISGLVYGALELRHHHSRVDAAAIAELATRLLAP